MSLDVLQRHLQFQQFEKKIVEQSLISLVNNALRVSLATISIDWTLHSCELIGFLLSK